MYIRRRTRRRLVRFFNRFGPPLVILAAVLVAFTMRMIGNG